MKSYLIYLVIIINLLSTAPADEWKFFYHSQQQFTSIWGNAANDIFAVGFDGLISHYDGSQWQEMASGTFSNLMDIWGSSSTDVFVVGGGGTILHYDGNQWNIMNSGTAFYLSGVWGTSNTDIFAVGHEGTILHYDGNQWTTMTSGIGANLNSIWGSSSMDVFAVGKVGTILHYDGSQWTTMTSGTDADLKDIWGTSSTDVFAVGTFVSFCRIPHGILCPYEGRVLHYDGKWTTITSLTSHYFTGIWGTSSTDLFVISAGVLYWNGGTIFHYNGNNLTTTAITSFTKAVFSIHDLWGSSKGDVFAASNEGILRCSNCQQPTQEYLPTTLANLTVATLPENQLIIQWNTALEIDSLGMNLWCAQLTGNQFANLIQLNSELIPSKAILTQLGASYSSVAYPTINTHLLERGIQHCILEDLNTGDQCTLHCDQIKTVVIGEKNGIATAELKAMNAKAIELCDDSQLPGVCLAQRLAPN